MVGNRGHCRVIAGREDIHSTLPCCCDGFFDRWLLVEHSDGDEPDIWHGCCAVLTSHVKYYPGPLSTVW